MVNCFKALQNINCGEGNVGEANVSFNATGNTKLRSTVTISKKRQTVTCMVEFYCRVAAKGPC